MAIAREPNRLGVPVHPGQVLLHDFLLPLGLSQVGLARHLGISTVRVNELTRGKRGITAETAWLLSEAFGSSPQFWLNLQSAFDLKQAESESAARIAEVNGAKEIYVFSTHGVLCGNAVATLRDSPIKKVIITDSIPLIPEKHLDKIEVLSVDKLFADAMWRIHENESVSILFE